MLRVIVPLLAIVFCASSLSMTNYECIVSGSVERLDQLVSGVESTMAILNAPIARDQLREDFGALLNNPQLAGVDMSRPINFYYYAGEDGNGIVWQLGVTDAELFHWSQFGHVLRNGGEAGALKIQNGVVAWSNNADVLRKFMASPPSLPETSGEVKVRIRVNRALQIFPQRFEEQFDAMRARMEQALSDSENAQSEIESAQRNLNAAIAAFRQLDECDMTLELENGLRFSASARPLAKAPLAVFLEAHPRGSLAPAAICPTDVDVLVVTNLTISGAIRSMIADALGFSFAQAVEGESASGDVRLHALMLKDAGRIELLDIRMGTGAVDARAQWDKLSQDLSPNRPIFLRPLPEPADLPNARLAQLVPNDAALGETASTVFRHFFGPVILAAQLAVDERVATVVSDEPLKRLKEIATIASRQQEGITASAVFSGFVTALPESPNLLLYVSARAVERWLAMGGLTIPAPTLGLAAAVRLDAEAIRAVIVIPAPM